uniref:Death domain-containing protein n=1 Tax=Amphimedon queenslandica TaxID=400682 RepID=A0A1X7V9J7_AMPQE
MAATEPAISVFDSTVTNLDFIEEVEGLLTKKGLEIIDLQVNLKKDDSTADLIPGKDWYSFGKSMKVECNSLDDIKENNKTLKGKKTALLHLLIERDNIRYEDIIYGYYTLGQSENISCVLDYLASQRKEKEPHTTVHKEKPLPSNRLKLQYIWQANYRERQGRPPPIGKKQEFSVETYKTQFYGMLWSEEEEHIQKLKMKCNGRYKLYITDNVPQEVKFLQQDGDLYGYIEDESFTDDKIEYATQASECVYLKMPDGSHLKAFLSQYNYTHIEQLLYINIPKGHLKFSSFSFNKEEGDDIIAQFEVKHSYFDHLHRAVVNIPSYVASCLLPNETSFSEFENGIRFEPRCEYSFMRLDRDQQTKALRMITSVPSHSDIKSCPPPVILYGPFGCGKTRILARAAYEIMRNRFNRRDSWIRILICAHHPQSVNTFIVDYFSRIKKDDFSSQFDIFLVSRYLGNPYPTSRNSPYYKTLDELRESNCDFKNLIIVTSYSTSLQLYEILNVPDHGYFTHVLLDEAAQVREPEAIIPLALATRDAKIVLAGDDNQVGPRTLVFGQEAKNCGLNVSLLTRLMERYKKISPVASEYFTKLTVNYRSHQSLLQLPELFYGPIQSTDNKPYWHHRGPTGYKFVCSDSRLVPDYIDKDQQLVEACIVLEEVLHYLKEMENEYRPPKVCIISSTRKQLNHIKKMASRYPCYDVLKKKKVSFLPSFMIQGHEFQAIFISLLEPLKDGKNREYLTKSLFNKFVFNTVITRAKSLVVCVAKPLELLDFEDQYIKLTLEAKCWHEYLHLCLVRGAVDHLTQSRIQKEVFERLATYKKIPFDAAVLKRYEELDSVSSSTSKEQSLLDDNLSTQSEGSTHLEYKIKESGYTQVKPFEMQPVPNYPKVTEGLSTQGKELTRKIEELKMELKSVNKDLLHTKEEMECTKEEMESEIDALKGTVKEKEKEISATKNKLEAVKKMAKAKDMQIMRQLSRGSASSPELEKQAPLSHDIKSLTKEKNVSKNHSDMCTQTEKYEVQKPSKPSAKLTVYDNNRQKGIAMIYGLFTLFILLTLLRFDLKIAPLPGVKVVASTKFLVAGGQSRQLNWEEFGFIMDIPKNALPRGFLAEVVIRVSLSGPYIYPDPKTWKPASAVYWISSSKDFINPVLLRIWHNMRGKTDLSSIKVLTADDNPENRTYIFKEVHDSKITINGPFVYILLNHFSSYTAVTDGDIRHFKGSLIYRKSPKSDKIWEYSFVVYKCHVNGIIEKLLDGSYSGWTYDYPEFYPVTFEDNSAALELYLTHNQSSNNWEFIEKMRPLICRKGELQNQIGSTSSLPFMLQWTGKGYPYKAEAKILRLSFSGAEQPKEIKFISNSIDEGEGNKISYKSGGVIPRHENLLEYVNKITKSKEFCWHLGMKPEDCARIERDEHSIKERIMEVLRSWQATGERTWKDLIKAIALTGECMEAKKFARAHNVQFDEEKDKLVFDNCPKINENLY